MSRLSIWNKAQATGRILASFIPASPRHSTAMEVVKPYQHHKEEEEEEEEKLVEPRSLACAPTLRRLRTGCWGPRPVWADTVRVRIR